MHVNLTCQYISSVTLTLSTIVVVIHLPGSVCYFLLLLHSLPHERFYIPVMQIVRQEKTRGLQEKLQGGD